MRYVLASGASLYRGIVERIWDDQYAGRGRPSALPRALHERVQQQLRRVICVCDGEWPLRYYRSGHKRRRQSLSRYGYIRERARQGSHLQSRKPFVCKRNEP
jgi:hypothetical protein